MRARPGFVMLALAVSLVGARVSHAAPDPKDEPAVSPSAPAPAELTKAKQLSLINKRLTKIGRSKITRLPDGRIRLTPHSHTHQSGARIRSMWGLYFENAGDGHDGTYTLSWAQPKGASQEIALEYPTEDGKVYVLDCRVRSSGRDASGKPVTFSPDLWASPTGSAGAMWPGSDGHVLVPFIAESAKTTIRITLQRAYSDYETVTWYGCDLLGAG